MSIEEKLKEQLHILKALCKSFDEGEFLLAKSISNHICVCCHSTPTVISSISYPKDNPIKNSLKFKKVYNMLETSKNNFKIYGIYLLFWNLHGGTIRIKDGKFIGIKINAPSIKSNCDSGAWISFYSNLLLNKKLPKNINLTNYNMDSYVIPSLFISNFKYWWEEEIIMELNNEKFTRKCIITWMRNKDGGSHIEKNENDKVLRQYRMLDCYLKNPVELKIISDIKDILYPGIYALVRTIAGEFIEVMDNYIYTTQ